MRKLLNLKLILILFLFSAIFMINITKTESITSTKENKENHLYINFVDRKLNQVFYQYDINQKLNNVLLKKKITEYPTATYSKLTNQVFFTYKTKNKTSQLFKKNLNSNQTTQLTYEFNHVDFLALDEKEQLLFMRVLMRGSDRNFQLAIYDLENKKIKNWDNKDKDKSIQLMDYNPIQKQLLLVTYSVKEEFEKIDHANKKGTLPKPPSYTFSIYNKEGKKVKNIGSINAFLTGASLSSDGKNILISYYNNLEEQTSKIESIDIAKQKATLLLQDSKMNIREPKYNKDKSGFYYLANANKQIKLDDKNANEVTINFYDLAAKKIKEVWSMEDGETVNFYID
ncbi:hypothetical protein [Metabacillus halosaccharovorans]|uniref:hypothetical protein n=1 Tax=Metabacillus halosaccharovorans TaxID=930124 RepID=UPI001C1F78A3|nr:hypothetical protein [Metabacillus halosaccharovorans]MBU7595716.1 hypothetical protein [Metabacillus halosaccharovorans]